jgi:hypothetical protein
MSTRADLLALQVPALAALMNMGLVKRAQKEIDAGVVPDVTVADDGTVVAVFGDGTRTTLAPGTGVRDAPCTCGAPGGCRHRVGAVLAYQRLMAATSAPAGTPPPSDSVAEKDTSVISAATEVLPSTNAVRRLHGLRGAWSPGDVEDPALVALLGAGNVDRAHKLRRKGYVADVHRGSFVGDDLPVVHLQTSSVRFLVPGDAAYGRCDCIQKTNCLHVALAVWAFREKDRRDRDAAHMTVEVGDGPTTSDARRAMALGTAMELVQLVLDEGLARLPGAATSRVALAKDALQRASLTWPLLAVNELESVVDAYQRRSALFSPERLRSVLVELVARTWATSSSASTAAPEASPETATATTPATKASGGQALPARSILGVDEALSTKLDQARFMGLGATVSEDGDDRRVNVILCDPGGQGTLVFERVFRAADTAGNSVGNSIGGAGNNAVAVDGPSLALRGTVAGTSLAVLSSGQVVSNAVTRQANRTVSFGTGGLQKTSVTRGGFDLARIPHDRVVRHVAAFLAQKRRKPPRWLRPRVVAEDVVIVVIHAVREVRWDPAAQAIVVIGVDEAGDTVIVERSHRALAPGATQALARLAQVGAPLIVVGDARPFGDALLVRAISVCREQLVVLDLEPESDAGRAAQKAVPVGMRPQASSPVSAFLDEVLTLLDHLCLHGLRTGLRSATDDDRRRRLERRATALGLVRVARALRALDDAIAAVGVTGSDVDAAVAVDAWASLAMRVELLRERCEG